MRFLPKRLTVNWHIQQKCNYKCSFCFAHFKNNPNIDREKGFKLLDSLKEIDIYKVNFAGGEPFMNPHLSSYLKHSHSIGLKTSIITNGTKMTEKWLEENNQYIDQIGLSIDSIHESTNKKLGRGFGRHVAVTKRCIERLNAYEHINKKINTVVTSLNKDEDWSALFEEHPVDRWKVFQVLKIEGENDEHFDELSVSSVEYNSFIERHKHIHAMVPESNDAMTESYLMMTPDGKFYQNSNGKYVYSPPVDSLTGGAAEALKTILFNEEKFVKRGGDYEL